MTPPAGSAYTAFRWPDDPTSRQAFEAVMRDPRGVSCWRSAYPAEPPHQGYVVVVMGEDPVVVMDHQATLLGYGGEPHTLDDSLRDALRLRRLRQAAHALDTGETFQLRRGIEDRLDPSGRMTPNRAARRKRKKR